MPQKTKGFVPQKQICAAAAKPIAHTRTKPLILFCGDAVLPTGFSRVTHSLLDRLSLDKWDIHVLGTNYAGQAHDYPYIIYPAMQGTDPYGINKVAKAIKDLQPDLVVILNDLWLIGAFLDQIPRKGDRPYKVVGYFPVDSEGYTEPLAIIARDLDLAITYTNFGVQVMRKAGFEDEIATLLHGVDTSVFYPIPKAEARKDIPEHLRNAFIVLNANRNQPRKRLDITIQGFCQFARDKPDAYLYLHSDPRDLGWDYQTVFHEECKRVGITNPTDRLLMTENYSLHNSAPLEVLNLIYNIADVHLNTSMGEGWGLCNHEGAACGVAQVVPEFASLGELFKGCGVQMPISQIIYETTQIPYPVRRGVVHPGDVASGLEKLYYDRRELEYVAKAGYVWATSAKYSWDAITQKFEQLLLKIL